MKHGRQPLMRYGRQPFMRYGSRALMSLDAERYASGLRRQADNVGHCEQRKE